jgi:hypothetical protein
LPAASCSRRIQLALCATAPHSMTCCPARGPQCHVPLRPTRPSSRRRAPGLPRAALPFRSLPPPVRCFRRAMLLPAPLLPPDDRLADGLGGACPLWPCVHRRDKQQWGYHGCVFAGRCARHGMLRGRPTQVKRHALTRVRGWCVFPRDLAWRSVRGISGARVHGPPDWIRRLRMQFVPSPPRDRIRIAHHTTGLGSYHTMNDMGLMVSKQKQKMIWGSPFQSKR